MPNRDGWRSVNLLHQLLWSLQFGGELHRKDQGCAIDQLDRRDSVVLLRGGLEASKKQVELLWSGWTSEVRLQGVLQLAVGLLDQTTALGVIGRGGDVEDSQLAADITPES